MKWVHESYGRVTSCDVLSRRETIQRTYRSINQTSKQNVQVDKYLRASSSSKSYFGCSYKIYVYIRNETIFAVLNRVYLINVSGPLQAP